MDTNQTYENQHFDDKESFEDDSEKNVSLYEDIYSSDNLENLNREKDCPQKNSKNIPTENTKENTKESIKESTKNTTKKKSLTETPQNDIKEEKIQKNQQNDCSFIKHSCYNIVHPNKENYEKKHFSKTTCENSNKTMIPLKKKKILEKNPETKKDIGNEDEKIFFDDIPPMESNKDKMENISFPKFYDSNKTSTEYESLFNKKKNE